MINHADTGSLSGIRYFNWTESAGDIVNYKYGDTGTWTVYNVTEVITTDSTIAISDPNLSQAHWNGVYYVIITGEEIQDLTYN
jgi:hypothetical protein